MMKSGIANSELRMKNSELLRFLNSEFAIRYSLFVLDHTF